jgi:hypothetical protein
VADGAVANVGVLGALLLRETLFDSLPSDAQVQRAIEGWGGDSYVTWIDSTGKPCLRDTFVGDTPGDTKELVQAITDAATELTGAQFGAFFYNTLDEHGESYTLYTLSGAPREAFEGFPMPRNTAVFAPTFRGEGGKKTKPVKSAPDSSATSRASGVFSPQILMLMAMATGF